MFNVSLYSYVRGKRKSFQKVTGFSFVEILVVLGIIVFLSIISFVVAGRIRENGRQSVCQSNLKQLAIAIQLYLQDSDGRYPIESKHNPLDGKWVLLTLPYVKNENIYKCPTQSRSSQETAGAYYAYNWRYLDQVTKVSSVITWMQTDAPDNAFFYSQEISSCNRDGTWSTWHSGGANYSFADGHVKWLTPNSIAELECSNPLLSR